MARSKDAWLREGAGDLQEADVEDVPVKGESVRVRALPAAYSNQAQSEATELKQVGRDQMVTVNKGKLEVLQFQHGVIDPTFTKAEAEQIAQNFGPAFARVIEKIQDLSDLGEEDIEAATDRFQGGGSSETGSDLGNGTKPGDGGPAVRPRTGAGSRKKRS